MVGRDLVATSPASLEQEQEQELELELEVLLLQTLVALRMTPLSLIRLRHVYTNLMTQS